VAEISENAVFGIFDEKIAQSHVQNALNILGLLFTSHMSTILKISYEYIKGFLQ